MLDGISIPRDVLEAHRGDIVPETRITPHPDGEDAPFGSLQKFGNRLTWLLILGVFCVCLTMTMFIYTFVFNLGSKGHTGSVGPTGATGPIGNAGAAGPRGPQGLLGPQGPIGPEGPQGTIGSLGPQGLMCWDINANNVCDPEEDIDGGGCSISDCRGVRGFQGPTGPTGHIGDQGPPGPGGGTNCWAVDVNNTCSTNYPNCNQSHALVADKNCDNVCDAMDCRGFDCHDLNMNHRCDLATEDINGDGNCTVADCIGPRGVNGTQGVQGIQGPTGATGAAGPTGPTGSRGLMCWDISGDTVCQRFCSLPAPNGVSLNSSNEDVNCDGQCNWLDCKGDQGVTGLTGLRGFNGTNGVNGINGINGTNGVNGTNGINGVNGATGGTGATGATGTAGFHCHDRNQNRQCDLATEDLDGDGACTVADCVSRISSGYFNFTNDVRNVGGTIFVADTTFPGQDRISACGWERTNFYVDVSCNVFFNMTTNLTLYRIYVPIPQPLRFINATYDPFNVSSGHLFTQYLTPSAYSTAANQAQSYHPELSMMRPVVQSTPVNDTFMMVFGITNSSWMDVSIPYAGVVVASRIRYKYFNL